MKARYPWRLAIEEILRLRVYPLLLANTSCYYCLRYFFCHYSFFVHNQFYQIITTTTSYFLFHLLFPVKRRRRHSFTSIGVADVNSWGESLPPKSRLNVLVSIRVGGRSPRLPAKRYPVQCIEGNSSSNRCLRVPPFPPRVDPHTQRRIPPGQRTTSDLLVRPQTSRNVASRFITF